MSQQLHWITEGSTGCVIHRVAYTLSLYVCLSVCLSLCLCLSPNHILLHSSLPHLPCSSPPPNPIFIISYSLNTINILISLSLLFRLLSQNLFSPPPPSLYYSNPLYSNHIIIFCSPNLIPVYTGTRSYPASLLGTCVLHSNSLPLDLPLSLSLPCELFFNFLPLVRSTASNLCDYPLARLSQVSRAFAFD